MVERTITYHSDSGAEYKQTILENEKGEIKFNSWKRNSNPLDSAAYMSNERYWEINKELIRIGDKQQQVSRLIEILKKEPIFNEKGGIVVFLENKNKMRKSMEIVKIDLPYSEENKDYNKQASSEINNLDAEIDQNLGNGN